jgi:hypothetical protein
MSYQQPTKVPQPGEGPLDLPPMAVVGHVRLPARPWPFSSAFWYARSDATSTKTTTQRLAIVRFVGHQTYRALSWPSTGSRYPDGVQCRFCQPYFCIVGTGHQATQRDSLIIYHYHPLGSLAFTCQAYSFTPLFAETKLPSKKARSHSSWPRLSNVCSRVCHRRVHTPWSSHRRSRRQHVVGSPYRFGISFHRDPVRKTHKIPFRVRRSSARGRPIRPCLGITGTICSHWLSLSSVSIAETSTYARFGQRLSKVLDFCNCL